ncbi:MAG: hypothetical protein L0Y74_05445, partial [candidate division Zixibacteria bacterium]|nr:hypothetical protein [candidate division Zixibacteria bacterium]
MDSEKRYSLLCLLVIIVATLFGISLAQDDYYQDKNGAVPLWYHPDKIVMRHVEGGGVSVASLLSLDSAFDQSIEPELTLFGFYFVWLVEGSNVASVVARLDTNQAVDVVN